MAAIAAGLAATGQAELVAVFAADLPFLARMEVDALRAALAAVDHDGIVFVDRGGLEQWLCGMYRAGALRRALTALDPPDGRPMHALVAGLRLATLGRPAGGSPPPWYDCDTEDDYRRAEEWA